jgi:hypothetical protein
MHFSDSFMGNNSFNSAPLANIEFGQNQVNSHIASLGRVQDSNIDTHFDKMENSNNRAIWIQVDSRTSDNGGNEMQFTKASAVDMLYRLINFNSEIDYVESMLY